VCEPQLGASVLGVDGVLREVVDSDLDAFFVHQREPEANRMAAFPARDREAFDAHWRRLLADDSLTKKTIAYEGEVAGNVGCWEQEGRRLVGYWIGREFWGKGLATRALQELTGEVTQRPLHAWVATSNVASIRVLEKCGFVRVGSQENDVEELLFELRDSP
jgi:RimJ/RimL family protein N-acetyltransferase